VLAFGLVGVMAVVAVIAAVAAVRTSRAMSTHRTAARRRTVFAQALGVGAAPVVTVGLQMALESGRGSRGVPLRSAIFGVVFGTAGVLAALIFGASLDHLAATPARYGWTWDFAAVPDDRGVLAPGSALLQDSDLTAVVEAETTAVRIDGKATEAWAFSALRGQFRPEIVSGRSPVGPDEVALGAATLSDLHRRIGDTVHADGPEGGHDYRIVGRTVFARFDTPQPLATGALFVGTNLEPLLGPNEANSATGYVVGRFAAGVQRVAAMHRLATMPGLEHPFNTTVPVEVTNLRQVVWMPVALAALLATLALLSVGHALVTSVRRRDHELAVLKSLGFDGRQVRIAIGCQATTLVVLGLIVGIPGGLVAGNLIWRLVVDGLGTSSRTTIPMLAVVLAIVVAVVAVNLVAVLPARTAARMKPAVALRST
jgi:hypothetical protein